jgi:hypothetical protein
MHGWGCISTQATEGYSRLWPGVISSIGNPYIEFVPQTVGIIKWQPNSITIR